MDLCPTSVFCFASLPAWVTWVADTGLSHALVSLSMKWVLGGGGDPLGTISLCTHPFSS
jgi:hypothetical protein